MHGAAGIHMFSDGRYRVNGGSTLNNPFSIRSLKNIVSGCLSWGRGARARLGGVRIASVQVLPAL